MEVLKIYHEDIPDFILEIAQTKEMKRLQGIGMNCGCEYTKFSEYCNILPSSRYTHSIGVGLIVWHFTKDIKQAIAGLLHDISTPAFSHVIDFLNNDHEKQESTEEQTYTIINESAEIQEILHRYQLQTDDVADYHKYPIADNDGPRLSADRLEYTLGNFYYRRLCSITEIKGMYDDLVIQLNEDNVEEMVFTDKRIAKEFTVKALDNSYYYVSNEDRFAMQYLADMLKCAWKRGVIEESDLYQNEEHVISLLVKDNVMKARWEAFTSFQEICLFSEKQSFYSVKINAKKRYINPLVNNQRIMDIAKEVNEQVQKFLDQDFNVWLSEKSLINTDSV